MDFAVSSVDSFINTYMKTHAVLCKPTVVMVTFDNGVIVVVVNSSEDFSDKEIG